MSLADVPVAVEAIRARWSTRPRVGVVLGTGMSACVDAMQVAARLDYQDIPGFATCTAPSHRGECCCGTLAGVPVVALAGRWHAYEGHSLDQVTLGVRVMAALGCEILILSNACGGMHPDYRAGDLVVLDDHINLTWANPLVGPHAADSTQAYPEMSTVYDRPLQDAALAVARRAGIAAHRGVYLGVLGPNYETRAEYRYFRRIGADVVGMSTVHEAIVARQLGLKVLALSIVTNECRPDALTRATSADVERVAAEAEPKLSSVLRGVVTHAVIGGK